MEQAITDALVWFAGELEFAWKGVKELGEREPWFPLYIWSLFQFARWCFRRQLIEDLRAEEEQRLKDQVTDCFDEFCDGDDGYTSATGKR